jgi:hypothetical protein
MASESSSDYDNLSNTSSIDDITFDLLNYKIKYNKLSLKLNLLEHDLTEGLKNNRLLNGEIRKLKAELDYFKTVSFVSLSGGFFLLYIYFVESFEPRIIYT